MSFSISAKWSFCFILNALVLTNSVNRSIVFPAELYSQMILPSEWLESALYTSRFMLICFIVQSVRHYFRVLNLWSPEKITEMFVYNFVVISKNTSKSSYFHMLIIRYSTSLLHGPEALAAHKWLPEIIIGRWQETRGWSVKAAWMF